MLCDVQRCLGIGGLVGFIGSPDGALRRDSFVSTRPIPYCVPNQISSVLLKGKYMQAKKCGIFRHCARLQTVGCINNWKLLYIYGMTKLTSIRQTLSQLKPELRQRFFVNSIGLFGSVVRNDFTEGSDIDIIVDFNKPIGVEFIDLAEYIEEKLSCKVDLVSKNGVKTKYFQEIEPEIIYV